MLLSVWRERQLHGPQTKRRSGLTLASALWLVRMPEIHDYWSKDPTFRHSPIAEKISRKRFEEILRYLHFVDNRSLPARGNPGYHRLQRVKPVVDVLKGRFLAVYKPGPNLSVDEAMIPFNG